MASSHPIDIDDVEMSCKGMQLLLNNDLDACQALFDRYRYYSPLMNGAWAFVSFMVRWQTSLSLALTMTVVHYL